MRAVSAARPRCSACGASSRPHQRCPRRRAPVRRARPTITRGPIFTYRWLPADDLRTHVFRALDDAVFAADLALRPRPALSPEDPTAFPPEAVDPRWDAAKRVQVAAELNGLNALDPADRSARRGRVPGPLQRRPPSAGRSSRHGVGLHAGDDPAPRPRGRRPVGTRRPAVAPRRPGRAARVSRPERARLRRHARRPGHESLVLPLGLCRRGAERRSPRPRHAAGWLPDLSRRGRR